MNTPIASMVFFLIASLLGALGQYFYKAGAETTGDTWLSYVVNMHILAGVACYVGVMMLFVAAFKNGGALTVLYPIYATTFIWAAVLALCVYGTPIKAANVLGMALLVAGMYLMGR